MIFLLSVQSDEKMVNIWTYFISLCQVNSEAAKNR